MGAPLSKLQFQLEFEPLLNDQFRTLKQVLAAAVYGARCGLAGVAGHCDLSPSALSRMLNENEDDPRHLPVDLMTKIIEVTGDHRPIHWLISKFLPDDQMRHRAAVAQFESLMPQIAAALTHYQKVKK